MTSDYLGVLLAAAPADVRARLAEIGEFVLGAENLAAMRSRQLRDPGTPSGAVRAQRPRRAWAGWGCRYSRSAS